MNAIKKPDRYERMVLAELKRQDSSVDGPAIWLTAPEIVKLLRREHAWMVRMVKRVDRWAVENVAGTAAIRIVADKLRERKK